MKIYLDGCDGSGKSTLADYLSSRFCIDKFCLTKDSEKSLKRYVNIACIDDVVCDRTFISELVYPTVFGREKVLSQYEADTLIDLYKSEGIIIVCTAHTEAIRRRLSERGDEFQEVLDNLQMINNEYIRIAIDNNILVVDTDITTKKDIGDYIERRLEYGRH